MIKELIINNNYREKMFYKLTHIDLVNIFKNQSHAEQKILDIISGDLSDYLEEYSRNRSDEKALLIRDLPLDQYIPQTPYLTSDSSLGIKTPIIQLILISIAAHLGTIIGFDSENSGAAIHNISPMKDKIHTKSGQGSKETIGMHTDFAFSDYRPDWLILMCLRNNQKIPTKICMINDICSQLTVEEIQLLKGDNFLIYPPDSSLIKTPRADAILFQNEHGFISRFNHDKCKGINEQSQLILNKFAYLADKLGCNVNLNAGDALLFDNKQVLHSRQSFTAKYDGTDRWLQRVYCKANNNLKKIKINIINDFKPSYGVA